MPTRSSSLATVLCVALAAGCGGAATFGLTADDNNPARLAQALALEQKPEAGKPRNGLGKPLAFLIATSPKRLVAFDLESKEALWAVPTDVESKVVIGRDFVAHREGTADIVARDLRTGQVRWTKRFAGTFAGLSADAERVYYVTRQGARSATLVALDGATGAERWRTDATGQLGAPAAQGGLLYVPFFRQWLAILDARTGEPLTRIRGIDEEILFVRTTGGDVYYGSRAGVFLLDERSASGKRAESTYGTAELPEEFVRGHFHFDAFDPIQSAYSAYDRNRILWQGRPDGDRLTFADDVIVVHSFRFFFAFGAGDGALRWAYSHPRVDVIGSEHVGAAIGFASSEGSIGALDPRSGRRIYKAQFDGRLFGATFDADGWQPAEGDAADDGTGTVEALSSIARDRDARFNDIKQFAVTALATLPGGDVTRDLLALIHNERTPPQLHDTAIEVLIARKEVEGLAHLLAVLGVPYDYIRGTAPRTVGVVARAIAAMGEELGAAQRAEAHAALLAQLQSPQTPVVDLAEVIIAMGAVGGGAELAPLRSFLLAYRADPAFSSQIAAVAAAIDVLLERGGPADRQVVAFVASDARTQSAVAAYAERALEQSALRRAEAR
jgi:hypothetical protein